MHRAVTISINIFRVRLAHWKLFQELKPHFKDLKALESGGPLHRAEILVVFSRSDLFFLIPYIKLKRQSSSSKELLKGQDL